MKIESKTSDDLDKNVEKAEKIRSSINKTLKQLFKGKNLAIIILSFLLFCYIVSYPNTQNYENTIKDLNNSIQNYEKSLKNFEEQIKKIQEDNQNLSNELESLKNERDELKISNESLKSENEKLKTDNANATSSTSTSISNTNITTITEPNTVSQMVWVGKTGTKYHKQSCGTLKGNGHQITLQEALNGGREACKVCY